MYPQGLSSLSRVNKSRRDIVDLYISDTEGILIRSTLQLLVSKLFKLDFTHQSGDKQNKQIKKAIGTEVDETFCRQKLLNTLYQLCKQENFNLHWFTVKYLINCMHELRNRKTFLVVCSYRSEVNNYGVLRVNPSLISWTWIWNIPELWSLFSKWDILGSPEKRVPFNGVFIVSKPYYWG